MGLNNLAVMLPKNAIVLPGKVVKGRRVVRISKKNINTPVILEDDGV